MTERPEIVKEEHLEYLDVLRESGITNMFGAGKYVAEEFDLSDKDAKTILVYWMKSFGERKAKPEEHEFLENVL
jgi:hypothetical protein